MRVLVLTSPAAAYPTLSSPQYLDYDNVFHDLSRRCEVHLVGNIVAARPYAQSQHTYPMKLTIPTFTWRNRLAITAGASETIGQFLDWLDALNDTQLQRFIVTRMKNNPPDILYAFPLPFERFPLMVAKKLGVPLVIEMWEDYVLFLFEKLTAMGLPGGCIDRFVARAYRWMAEVARGADRVIVPSTVLSERLQNAGISNRKIRRIPVCVKSSPETVLGTISGQRIANRGEITVFHIGSAAPWHDLDTLLEALRHVRSKLLVMISGGVSKQLLAAQDTGNIRVVVTGRVTPAELSTYLAAADICVAPYRFHQPSGFFPAKVIRYMLAAKAIVATNLPEIREMFKGQKAGLLVPTADPIALAKAIDYLAENPAERQQLGATAIEIAQKNYLVEHHTTQLNRVFRESV